MSMRNCGMLDVLASTFFQRSMFEPSPETQRELSLDDPWLIETLWDTARLGLVPDGGLRALFISGVDARSGQAVIDLIRESYPEHKLEQHATEVPATLAGFTWQKAIEAARVEDGYHVNFNVQDMWLCLIFDDWDALELTIDAREVYERNFGALVELMIRLSQATSRVCYLTDCGAYPADLEGAVIQAIDDHRGVAILPAVPFLSDTVSLPI